ncbi:hypothetical protein Pcinc_024318 [Petrolisthes cinctipes]|uniref:Uncharacterized protein n=1 Tax=Petrolisthes cinctipes TaxID=88211 RepID=A0AAE1KDR0_PETCI|nr:hypothetical protein Pcinc_024318 [Petrolisthes cinctipes]
MSNQIERRWLCRETLELYLACGSLEDLTSKHSPDYPVLLGKVEGIFGVNWFNYAHSSQNVLLPGDLPRFGLPGLWGCLKSCLLARRNEDKDGKVSYLPLMVCQIGINCNPYIVNITSLIKLEKEKRLMVVSSERSGYANLYTYVADVAYTRTKMMSVEDFIDSLQSPKSFYAVVEDDSGLISTHGFLIRSILFITSSWRLALGAISALVGNHSTKTQEEMRVSSRRLELGEASGGDFTQEPNGRKHKKDANGRRKGHTSKERHVEESASKKENKKKGAKKKKQREKDISEERCVEENASKKDVSKKKNGKENEKKLDKKKGASKKEHERNTNDKKDASGYDFEDETSIDEPQTENASLVDDLDDFPLECDIDDGGLIYSKEYCLGGVEGSKNDDTLRGITGYGVNTVGGVLDEGSDREKYTEAKEGAYGHVVGKSDREQITSESNKQLSDVFGEASSEQTVAKVNKPILRLSSGAPCILSCFLKTWDDTYGILRSDPAGYIMIKRKHNIILKTHGLTVDSLLAKCLCAVVMELQKPETILGYNVTLIGLLVWAGEVVEDWEGLMRTSLDVYREDWDVQCPESHIIMELANNPFRTKIGRNCILSQMKINANQQQHNIIHTEVTVNMSNSVENVVCRRVVNENDFLVLTAKNNMTALVLKKNFYKDKVVPQLAMWKKSDLKTLTTGITALPLPLTEPFRFKKHQVTHFAVVAYTGKKPPAADRILARWREGEVERNTTLHIQGKDCMEVINLIFKLHNYSVPFTTELSDIQESGCKVTDQKPSPRDNECGETSTGDATKINCDMTTECTSPEQNIEVVVNMAPPIESLMCQCAVVENDFLILISKGKIVLALKRNFFKNKASTPASRSLVDQLKNMPGPGVSVLAVKVTSPVCVEDIRITHFALVAYIGKKPSTVDDIIAKWKADRVHDMDTTVYIDGSEGQKVIEFSFTVEYVEELIEEEEESLIDTEELDEATGALQSQIPEYRINGAVSSKVRKYLYQQVKPKELKPKLTAPQLSPSVSTPYVMIKIIKQGLSTGIETNNARVFHAGKDTGILEVKDENVAGIIYIFFKRESVYINKEPLNETLSVEQQISQLVRRPFNCEARLFPTRNGKNKTTIIRGIQVHFIANMVWYGEKPFEGEKKSTNVPHIARSNPKPKDTKVGHIIEVQQHWGIVRLEDGLEFPFSRCQCFLFGVSLKKVDLCHTLSVGDRVTCELRVGLGGLIVSGVWLQKQVSTNLAHLPATLDRWCRGHSLPEPTRALMLMEAGWLSPDLNPLADCREEKEVVEVG